MEQLATNELRFACDQENDVAYVSLGEPKDAVCETLDNGVVIKRDPVTRKIVGLILLDVSHWQDVPSSRDERRHVQE